MSPASHMTSRLRKLYGIIWNRMRFLNERAMHPHVGHSQAKWRSVVEQLEPRLLLSGTTYVVSSQPDVIDSGALDQLETLLSPNTSPAAAPDSQVDSLMYTRTIDWEAGALESYRRLALYLEASLVDEIVIHLPWGETEALSTRLPVGWNGEYFEVDFGQDSYIQIRSLETNPDPSLDTYRYDFSYAVRSTSLEADAWWQAVDVVPTEVLVEFPDSDDWSTLLDFDDVPMPDATPELLQPLPFTAVDSLRPTIEWTPWITASEMGKVELRFDAYDGDDEHGGWWLANPPFSEWTPDRDLLAGQAYEYRLEFYNDIWDSSSGTSLGTRSSRRKEQSLTVIVTPGGTVDLRADVIQGNAATVEAGGYIPGWIEMINAGSDPVVFPWQIVTLSEDKWDPNVPWDPDDPSVSVLISDIMGLGVGEAMNGGGQVYIPADLTAGTYLMFLVLDPDGLVSEADEANNLAVSDPFTVTVPANFPPIAVLDVFQCDRNDSLTVTFADLTANDFDYNDDSLSVVTVTPIIDQTHGTLQVVGDQITYTPDADYYGPARFEYTITDSVAQATGVVNISVEETAYVYTVDSLLDVVADDGFLTLREAIQAASTNLRVNEASAGSATEMDIITFDQVALQAEAGVGNPMIITLDGLQLAITDDLYIQGLGADVLTIDANELSRVFYVSGVDHKVELFGLTIMGGATTDHGGGIYNEYGTLTVKNSTISGNSATFDGGGIFNEDGTLILMNSTVSSNSADGDGGGIYNQYGALALMNTTMSGNSATTYGGGIYDYHGTLTLTNTIVARNSTPDYGGGIFGDHGALTLTNTTVSGNSVGGGGAGGIHN